MKKADDVHPKVGNMNYNEQFFDSFQISSVQGISACLEKNPREFLPIRIQKCLGHCAERTQRGIFCKNYTVSQDSWRARVCEYICN